MKKQIIVSLLCLTMLSVSTSKAIEWRQRGKKIVSATAAITTGAVCAAPFIYGVGCGFNSVLAKYIVENGYDPADIPGFKSFGLIQKSKFLFNIVSHSYLGCFAQGAREGLSDAAKPALFVLGGLAVTGGAIYGTYKLCRWLVR